MGFALFLKRKLFLLSLPEFSILSHPQKFSGSFFGDRVGGLPCSQPLLPISMPLCVISCSSGVGQRDLRRLLGDLSESFGRNNDPLI